MIDQTKMGSGMNGIASCVARLPPSAPRTPVPSMHTMYIAT